MPYAPALLRVTLILLPIFFYLGCVQENTYRGHLIEIDFSTAGSIGDEEWVEIDGVRFVHYTDFEKAHQDVPHVLPLGSFNCCPGKIARLCFPGADVKKNST